MTIIPKGETHSWAFAKFGEEVGDRYIVDEDIVVIPKQDYDKVQGILAEMRKGHPPGDQTPASLACYTFADRIDKALSGNEAGETNKKGKTMPEYTKYIRCHIVKATPMTRGNSNAIRGKETPANENAADEGYHVVYPDGYESWCPKAQFEEVSRPIDGMTFGQAIDACRYKGAKIQRANWNGKGQFVRFDEILAPKGGQYHFEPEVCADRILSVCFVFHFIDRKTGKARIQVGWLASQADMAANDWVIVE